MTNRLRITVAWLDLKRDMVFDSETIVELPRTTLGVFFLSVMDRNKSETGTDLVADAARSWYHVPTVCLSFIMHAMQRVVTCNSAFI